MFCSSPPSYLWESDSGVRTIEQGEGREQGDALMPLLFSLGQHAALHAVQGRLEAGERLFAFLDDIWVVIAPDRVGPVYTAIREALWEHSRIQVHVGKTKVWNSGGMRPVACDMFASLIELGRSTTSWQRHSRLGLGSNSTQVRRGRGTELELWERIGWVPDVQCAWQILLQCAGPRCHHWLRTVPPQQSAPYSASHDSGMWQAVATLLGRMPGNTTAGDGA